MHISKFEPRLGEYSRTSCLSFCSLQKFFVEVQEVDFSFELLHKRDHAKNFRSLSGFRLGLSLAPPTIKREENNWQICFTGFNSMEFSSQGYFSKINFIPLYEYLNCQICFQVFSSIELTHRDLRINRKITRCGKLTAHSFIV